MVQSLINGSKNSTEVARWAEEISYPENTNAQERLDKIDPPLAQLLSDLGMADLPGDTPDEKLFGKESYQQWLQDFLIACEEDKKN